MTQSEKYTAAAYLVSASYALSWPIASAVSFDFHEAAFAPVLMAVALERIQAGRLRTALIALAALLLMAGCIVQMRVAEELRSPWMVNLAIVTMGYCIITTFGLLIGSSSPVPTFGSG